MMAFVGSFDGNIKLSESAQIHRGVVPCCSWSGGLRDLPGKGNYLVLDASKLSQPSRDAASMQETAWTCSLYRVAGNQ